MKLVDRLNTALMALLLLMIFIALAIYSQEQRQATNKEASAFIQQKLQEYKHPRSMTQEQALYEVWGLTQEDAVRPVNIFAEAK